MRSVEHWEPYDMVLDWQEAKGRDFTPEEQEVAAEAAAQIAAYTGRMYGEIRMDIARCAVASLDALQGEPQPANVTPLRTNRSDIYAATRYVATTSRA